MNCDTCDPSLNTEFMTHVTFLTGRSHKFDTLFQLRWSIKQELFLVIGSSISAQDLNQHSTAFVTINVRKNKKT